jgi:hypothetical protein
MTFWLISEIIPDLLEETILFYAVLMRTGSNLGFRIWRMRREKR